MFLRKIIYKMKGVDEFYLDLDIKQTALYQKYFSQIINVVDIHNLTERSLGRNYDQQKINSDYDKIEKILNEVGKDNLKPIYLHVMFEQYVYADVWQRERYNDQWVKKVMGRQSMDFFPSPGGVLHILYPEKYANYR